MFFLKNRTIIDAETAQKMNEIILAAEVLTGKRAFLIEFDLNLRKKECKGKIQLGESVDNFAAVFAQNKMHFVLAEKVTPRSCFNVFFFGEGIVKIFDHSCGEKPVWHIGKSFNDRWVGPPFDCDFFIDCDQIH